MKVIKAVIPAAGWGTRFLPATKASPKEMLPLVDKPLIQYAVEEALEAGIKQFIIITGRNKRALEDHFDYSVELEQELKEQGKDELLKTVQQVSEMADFVYIRQKKALGLGHAILQAKEVVGKEPFAILYPDNVFDGLPPIKQVVGVCQKLKINAVIGFKGVPKDQVYKYGIAKPKYIDKEGKIFQVLDIVQKPKPEVAPSNLNDIGRMVLPWQIFKILEETKPGVGGEIQLTDAIKTLCKKSKVYGVEVDAQYFDVGTPGGLWKANVYFGLKHHQLNGECKEYLKSLRL